jgi:hypothetical protein
MLRAKVLPRPKRLPAVVALLALFLLGCSVREEHKDGEKKVEIRTPVADLKINTDAGAQDTGLPVYPGARTKPGDKDNQHSANFSLYGASFGVRLVVVEYESDDAPEKILTFYKDKMKSYGDVLECRDSDYVSMSEAGDDHDSGKLTCGKHGHRGNAVELKVGTPHRQRIMAVKARGSGSEFALVYLETRGKDNMM